MKAHLWEMNPSSEMTHLLVECVFVHETPSETENRVSSFARITLKPGRNGVPTWRTMTEPGWAVCPP